MYDSLDFAPTNDPTLNVLLNAVEHEINMTNDLIMPNDMVQMAANQACEFFGMPASAVVDMPGTCMASIDPTSLMDDMFGFNRSEMMEMGISGQDSLSLVYAHECGHRALQALSMQMDSWTEELACDMFAGIMAGARGIDLTNFEAALGVTEGSDSHPNGALRTEFIEYGRQMAEEMSARGIELSYENCLERFQQHLNDREGIIEEYRTHFMGLADNTETKPAPGPVETDGTIAHHDLADRKESGREETTGTTALTDEPNSSQVTFKGFNDDRAWNEKQAQACFENAAWHEKEAEAAAERGDHSSANDHIKSARSEQARGNDYKDAARRSTK